MRRRPYTLDHSHTRDVEMVRAIRRDAFSSRFYLCRLPFLKNITMYLVYYFYYYYRIMMLVVYSACARVVSIYASRSNWLRCNRYKSYNSFRAYTWESIARADCSVIMNNMCHHRMCADVGRTLLLHGNTTLASSE